LARAVRAVFIEHVMSFSSLVSHDTVGQTAVSMLILTEHFQVNAVGNGRKAAVTILARFTGMFL